MREYRNVIVRKKVIDKIYCNCCGKEIKGDYLAVEKTWDYLSGCDGETHSFDLCEDCYNRIISDFKIAVKKNNIF